MINNIVVRYVLSEDGSVIERGSKCLSAKSIR